MKLTQNPFHIPTTYIATKALYWILLWTATGALAVCFTAPSLAQSIRILPPGERPDDVRLKGQRNLDSYFPFDPPASREEWNNRSTELRRRVLLATGLWPMPERTPPQAVIHGKVDRDDYTVERVFLQSYPGHFVTGSLYRPKGKPGKVPVVLCPHGHWPGGRFQDVGEENAKKQIAGKGEQQMNAARHPLQARCVQLARMGCMVFHYDMLGFADSVQVPAAVSHAFAQRRPEMESDKAWGFHSPQAELRMQNIMGLQTYNSLRVLDWICELPEVDAERIAVTGASGGGTQTFILSAIDSRPTVAFPAVMVSTAMQGGCACENCTYLRIGAGNVDFAALTAPRALGLTAANDWTREMTIKGMPQLQQLYKLFNAPDNVRLTSLTHFDHNYNLLSRTAMYELVNQHLKLGAQSPIVERDFAPLSPAELTVWTDEHPAPKGDNVGEAHERTLLKSIDDASQSQIAAIAPTDGKSLDKHREVIGGAWKTIISREIPKAGEVSFMVFSEMGFGNGHSQFGGLMSLPTQKEQLPVTIFRPHNSTGQVVVWLDDSGRAVLFDNKGEPTADVVRLLDAGYTVVGVDLIYQGDFLTDGTAQSTAPRTSAIRNSAAFTLGYNHPVFVKRVHDVLTAISYAKHEKAGNKVTVLASGPAAAIALAARARAGDAVEDLMIDTQGYRLGSVKSIDDLYFVPGAVKYGDLPALVALNAPRKTWVTGETAASLKTAQQAYKAGDREKSLTLSSDPKASIKAANDEMVKLNKMK
ncbi:MAG: alpha/beta hydrolase family protein [Planctomycetota bacterium]|nr:alpha/beta hydrolase family protein [Planctomycetota bacterium]